MGGLSTNSEISIESENKMLEIYFGKTLNEEQIQSYTAMKCASLLRETMWSMVSEITSEIDYNYRSYTDLNYSRYIHAMKQSEF